jgi:hypothetical protein
VTPEARNRWRIHKKARERWLEHLYARQNSMCYWCRSQTVLLRYISEEQELSCKNGFVTWRDGENVFAARIASVDHIRPVSDGGTNDPANLVMACVDCNQNRTRTLSPIPDEIRRLCPICAGPKDARRSMCLTCHRKTVIDWLEANGWVIFTSAGGHERYVDPLNGDVHKFMKIAAKVQDRRKNEPAARG